MSAKSFLRCLDCGYLNDVDAKRCGVCGGEKLVFHTEKRKLNTSYLYLFSVLLLLFVFLVNYLLSSNRKNTNFEDITFVSERIPSNYYTYLSSLNKISNFKQPDENDINALINSLRYEDERIRSISCKTLKRWKKLPPRYFQLCLKY